MKHPAPQPTPAPQPMDADELSHCLAVLRWSQRGLADGLKCDERRVRRWCTRQCVIPQHVANAVRKLAAYHRANPLPRMDLQTPNLAGSPPAAGNDLGAIQPHA